MLLSVVFLSQVQGDTSQNFKVRVINGQYIIDVSICEVELRCQPFPTGREQGLYEFRFRNVFRGNPSSFLMLRNIYNLCVFIANNRPHSHLSIFELSLSLSISNFSAYDESVMLSGFCRVAIL